MSRDILTKEIDVLDYNEEGQEYDWLLIKTFYRNQSGAVVDTDRTTFSIRQAYEELQELKARVEALEAENSRLMGDHK